MKKKYKQNIKIGIVGIGGKMGKSIAKLAMNDPKVFINSGIENSKSEYIGKDIGDLVFSSGLSTADKVTDISGRGVGMDAVRSFLEKHGGSIYLEFDNESSLSHESETAHFTWVIKIPEEQIQKAA